ncbi:MAG: hypothetical protein H6573_08400 [Lewinellaceae bacterium]|nr:hypothetical protein [Lewinellaceae bacterium]
MPLKEIEALLFDSLYLEPRKLPVSDILLQRQEQVVQLLQTWDAQLEAAILVPKIFIWTIPANTGLLISGGYLDKAKYHPVRRRYRTAQPVAGRL